MNLPRSRIDACPLTCSIVPVEQIYSSFPTEKVLSKGKRKGETLSYFGNNGYLNWADIQKNDLPLTKKLFPEYKQLHSQVLQDVIARVEYAFSRFIFPDKNGKTSGRPRFKGKHYYKSFTYAQMSRKDIYRNNNGRNVVKLSKIGEVELVLHRKIPNGFSVKTRTVIKEADGWYISLVLEDKTVPELEVAGIQPTEENSIGVDLGLEFYAALSTSKVIENPRFLRKTSLRLAKLQQKLSQRKKSSKPWQIIKRKIAKLHQKIKRQRLDFQFN